MTRATGEWMADFERLTDAEWRRAAEVERGIFIAEGMKVIARAIELGFEPRTILTQAKWLPRLQQYPDLDVRVVSDSEIAQIAGYHVHRGALAAFERPAARNLADLILRSQRLLVVEEVVDNENIGGLFRNAAGLGVDAVLLTAGCADPLYRRSIKVSMGATLAMPYAIFDGGAVVAQLKAADFQVIALTPAGEVALDALRPAPKWALLVGAEGDGLTAPTLAAADLQVSIPMQPGIDSLNVATAAAIAMWQLARH